MQLWARQELRHAAFGDARLNRRLVRMVEDLAAQPSASVPQACGDWAATKAAYRFWDSSKVTPAKIREAHQKGTQERVAEQETVLLVQDTTNLDFTHHPGTEGLGYLDNRFMQGLKVHSALAVSAEGVPQGLIHQEVWARDPAELGKSQDRRKRAVEAKESQRWLTAHQATQATLEGIAQVVTVADREADMYDLFALPRRPGEHLLIRGSRDRRVDHETGYLESAIRDFPVCDQRTIELRRKADQPARQATLSIRYATLAIHPPRHHRRRASLDPIPLQVVLVEEENPPPETEPVCWLLLTTLPVDSLAQAEQCLVWYSYRWLIERYHYVLKSGCRLEELQLKKAERIERALATYCIVAWRLLWLTYKARRTPDAPCDAVFETYEWQALYCWFHKTPVPPPSAPTLRQAVRWIAQLGGFLGRKSDGDPGVKVIWQGLRRLSDIAETWRLVYSSPP